MKKTNVSWIVLIVLLVKGCTVVTTRPTRVGVPGGYGSTASPGSSTARPTHPTPTGSGIRGIVVFPLYYNLGMPRDAVAEVWIDGVLVGRIHAGRPIVYKIDPGVHIFLSRVYGSEDQPGIRVKPRSSRPLDAQEQEEETYLGCSSGTFEIGDDVSTDRFGISWRLNLPPPSRICE